MACRYKHLCVTRSCLAGWERLGYNGDDVAQYLNITRWIADHPNTALDLRIEHGSEYKCGLLHPRCRLACFPDAGTPDVNKQPPS